MLLRQVPTLSLSSVLCAAALALLAAPACAERPMVVDDAGTLDLYGAKLEMGRTRDARTRGWEVVAGFSPIENLELEINGERARDHDTDPTSHILSRGFAAKWVPLKSEHGLSAGMKLELGRVRTDDRQGTIETERGRTLLGLASWRFESGQLAHLNLGRERIRVGSAANSVNTWGVGFDQPLTESLHLTAETFGKENMRPDKQLGLRWEVAEGLKLSIAAGRGNDRNIGSAGVAWEF